MNIKDLIHTYAYCELNVNYTGVVEKNKNITEEIRQLYKYIEKQ